MATCLEIGKPSQYTGSSKRTTDTIATPKGPETLLGIFFIPVSSWVSEVLILPHLTVEGTKLGKFNIHRVTVLKPE